jgi:hypothetical protein
MKYKINKEALEKAFINTNWIQRMHPGKTVFGVLKTTIQEACPKITILLKNKYFELTHFSSVKKDPKTGHYFWKERQVVIPYDNTDNICKILPGLGHVRVCHLNRNREESTYIVPDVKPVSTLAMERAVIETLSGERIAFLKSNQRWQNNGKGVINKREREISARVIGERRKKRQQELFGSIYISTLNRRLKQIGFIPERVIEILGEKEYKKLLSRNGKEFNGRIKARIGNHGKQNAQGLYLCMTNHKNKIVSEIELDWYKNANIIETLFSPKGYVRFSEKHIAFHLRKELWNLQTSLEFNKNNLSAFMASRTDSWHSKYALYCDFLKPGFMVHLEKQHLYITERRNIQPEKQHGLGILWEERQIKLPVAEDNLELLKFLVPEHVIEDVDIIKKQEIKELPQILLTDQGVIVNQNSKEGTKPQQVYLEKNWSKEYIKDTAPNQYEEINSRVIAPEERIEDKEKTDIIFALNNNNTHTNRIIAEYADKEPNTDKERVLNDARQAKQIVNNVESEISASNVDEKSVNINLYKALIDKTKLI